MQQRKYILSHFLAKENIKCSVAVLSALSHKKNSALGHTPVF